MPSVSSSLKTSGASLPRVTACTRRGSIHDVDAATEKLPYGSNDGQSNISSGPSVHAFSYVSSRYGTMGILRSNAPHPAKCRFHSIRCRRQQRNFSARNGYHCHAGYVSRRPLSLIFQKTIHTHSTVLTMWAGIPERFPSSPFRSEPRNGSRVQERRRTGDVKQWIRRCRRKIWAGNPCRTETDGATWGAPAPRRQTKKGNVDFPTGAEEISP